MVFKNLLRRKVRTFLSFLGVAVGVSAIVAFSAIGDGVLEGINRYFADSHAQLVLISSEVRDLSHSRISQKDARSILAVPGVVEISETTWFIANPKLLGSTTLPVLPLFGRDPSQRLTRKYANPKLQGSLFQNEDEIMLGNICAQNYGKKVGDVFDLLGHPFRVSAVYEVSMPLENGGAVVHNKVIQERLGMGDAFSIGYIYLSEGADPERIAAEIKRDHPNLTALGSGEVTGYFDELEYIEWFVWIVSIISIFVGGLGVLNTMLMSVSERVREIGTLRAVGWTRGMVMRLILGEGMLISVIGGVSGMVGGALLASALIETAPQGTLQAVYTQRVFLQATAVALILGLVGSLYPAWQASRLSPIEALKYE